MTLLLITTLLLSALGSISSSEPRQFHVVKERKTWTEAQQYCREKFTDLATIDDMTEMEKVNSTIHEAGAGSAWIGLKLKWQWSLADEDFYRENETEFRNWGAGEPSGGGEECVLGHYGIFYDSGCSTSFPFVCYDGNSTHPYVLVTDEKNWADAQRYCREQHTDLASVRNQEENDQIENLGATEWGSWIGLFRAAWSDGSTSSFRHWSTGEADNPGVACTAVVPSGQWEDEDCHHPRPFVCYGGLGSLSSSVPRQFHVVKERKNWTEAQQYCREKFTDLATIDDMTEMEKVKSMINEAGAGNAWIGLKQGKWRWSLANRDFYRENEAEFRNWATGEPSGGGQECVIMWKSGKWIDELCSASFHFICYDGGNSTHPYVLVTDEWKNWEDAQRYCREKHTDLASVRNQAENDQISKLITFKGAWISLVRAAWSKWSDGSSSSFSHWSTGQPNNVGVACTAVMPSGQWYDEDCHHTSPFICYGEPKEVKRQIVRVDIKVASHVNIHDPAVQQAFLQQIQQRLRDSGMPADAKLTWRTQPDGKIFKEKKEKKEEGRKRRKRTEL